MLSKCANPECTTQLHYLREGKVFMMEKNGPAMVGAKRPPARVEYFWLCGPCSKENTLSFDQQQGVRLKSKVQKMVRRAAAS
jgi:hypothetical protein